MDLPIAVLVRIHIRGWCSCKIELRSLFSIAIFLCNVGGGLPLDLDAINIINEFELISFVICLQCLSVVPLEIFRWVVAGVAGFMSASFVALNLKTHIASAGERWFLIVAAIFLLQVALAIVLKIYLFTVSV